MTGEFRRFGIALAFACVLVLAFALPAQAGFAPGNEPIVEAEQFDASIATDPAGDSLVVWHGEAVLGAPPEVKARRLAADGTLGPIFDLAPGDIASRPVAAMAAGGRAFVAWESVAKEGDPASVKGRWVEPSGALGPLLTLVQGEPGIDAIDVQVVVDPAGIATVSWENEAPGTLFVRRVSPGSMLGASSPDISGGGGVTNHVIAALPNGSTVAVWRGTGTEKNVVTAAGAVGAPETISETSGAGDNEVVVDGLGNALVVWRQSGGGNYSVRGRLLDPAGASVGTELTIDPPGTGFVGPQVRASADGAGDFLVTWNRQDGAGDAIVHAQAINAAGAFLAPAQPLSASLLDSSGQQSALLDRGVGAVVWDSGEGELDRILGREVLTAGLPLTPEREIFGDFGSVTVASARAAGVAAFLVEYPVSGSAQGAVVRRFLVPPVCRDLAAPTVRHHAVVAIDCSGPALENAHILEAPRHGSVSAFDPATRSFTYRPLAGFDGVDSFTYSGVNDGGGSPAARVTILVSPPATDVVKPVIYKLRAIKKMTKRKARRLKSVRFRLVLSEPASAEVRVKRIVPKAKKRRVRKIGTVTKGIAGQRLTIPVRGRLAKKIKAGGRFRAIAVVTDPAGNRSKVKKITFRVPRPPALR